ncbi:hypothetical protein [Nocardioides sp.]|uniref:hypothetical protein n=1 Tax=Nocardioides sp. TaxID=35761 RepID=UPI00356B0A98
MSMSAGSAASVAWGKARAPFDAAVVRARLTVVPRRPVSAPRLPFVTLVSLVLLGGIVGLLCFNTQMQQASFAAATLEERAANLTARQQTLEGELEELRDPQHLAVVAGRAGMVAPQNACTLRLGGGADVAACTVAVRGNTPSPHAPVPRKPRALDPAPVVVTVSAAPAGNAEFEPASDRGDRARDTARR